MAQLKKFIAAEVTTPRADWKAMLDRFEVGDKQLFKDYTQAALGSYCSGVNKKGEKRFVTKAAPQGAYIIRVR